MQEFKDIEFQRSQFGSSADLTENVIELKKSRFDCISKATGLNPDGKLTMYAVSLEYVSEKMAEDILTRCKLFHDPRSGGEINFTSNKSKSLKDHLNRVESIPEMSDDKRSILEEECASIDCYGSLNRSLEIFEKLEEINKEVKRFHSDFDRRSREGRQPEWTHMND